MKTLLIHLFEDEAAFIVSAELILISTIATLSMVVGLSEVSVAVNKELRDVAKSFRSVNQGHRHGRQHDRSYADDAYDDDWDDYASFDAGQADWDVVSFRR